MTLNEPEEIRRAFACYPTGVAIATTALPNGAPVGMTISSFNTVSLDPPLVLWNLGTDSCNFEAFSKAKHFAVHVLASNQQGLSARFATREDDKFEGLECGVGVDGDPILPEFAACFECRTEFQYAGGDHMIIVGRVTNFEDRALEPLIFHRSQYRATTDNTA